MSTLPPTSTPTPDTAAAPALQQLCIAPHQPLPLTVAAGSELFCITGHIALHSGPQGLVDGMASLQWPLSPGQRWRAPCTLWLQIHAAGGPARLQASLTAVSAQTPAPVTLRQRLRGLGRLFQAGGRRTAAG